jgi:hypothetical protein
MPAPLGGSGLGLQLPQNLYPSELGGNPYDYSTNRISLSPGDTLPIQRGSWLIGPDGGARSVSFIQFKDPVTQQWKGFRPIRSMHFIDSDGFNVRLANLTGCPICAVVTAGGSGYAQATTTCVAGTGNSTWQPIVGGMVSVTSMANVGGNYGVAPEVFIPAPPYPGIPATAYATIGTGGTVSGVTMINVGAGYTSTPIPVIMPSATDPNLAAGITQASVVMGTLGSGAVTGVLCTNPGVSLTAAPTLTISGAGSAATAVAQRLTTLNGATIYAAGAGFVGGGAMLTLGGVPSDVPVYSNPTEQLTNFVPLPANALLAAPVGNSLASVSAIYDGGLFLGAVPAAIVLPLAGSILSTGASVAALVGAANDTLFIQPLSV